MNKVAVVVSNINDQQMIAQVLADHNFCLFDRNRSVHASRQKFSSVVVCHRTTEQAASPCLPKLQSDCRMIVISDCTDENVIIDTLYAGAHHFISFGDPEWVLKARADAALRRHPLSKNRTFSVQPYVFNTDSRTAFYEKRKLDLTASECGLAHYLFLHRSRVVTMSELLINVWTLPPSLDTRRIDTTICNIRKKMKLNTVESEWKLLRLRRTGFKVCRESV